MLKSNFQMNNPILQNVVLKLNDKFESSEGAVQLVISDAKNVNRNSENTANVSYSIRVFDEEFKSGGPFFIEVSYSADFRWSDLDEKDIENLLNHNAPAILLGYIRPLIAQLSSGAGFPPLHLPLLNLQGDE